MDKFVAPKITSALVDSSSPLTVENGESILVYAIILTFETNLNPAILSIRNGDEIIHRLPLNLTANRDYTRVINIPFKADQGLSIVSNTTQNKRVCVFHSHPGS